MEPSKRVLLPKDQRRRIGIVVGAEGELILQAYFHKEFGYITPTSIPFSDFSQTLTSFDDLERIVVEKTKLEAPDSQSALLARFVEKYGAEEGLHRYQVGEEEPP